MDSNGIMEAIRGLLATGKSSGEVIALGYKPPTVYKVLRLMRQRQEKISTHGRVPNPSDGRHQEVAMAHLTIGRNEQGDLLVLAYFNPDLSCPGCQTLTGEWIVCPLCNRLMPLSCTCPLGGHQDSSHGYIFQDLISTAESRQAGQLS